jgi:hypothetical protein
VIKSTEEKKKERKRVDSSRPCTRTWPRRRSTNSPFRGSRVCTSPQSWNYAARNTIVCPGNKRKGGQKADQEERKKNERVLIQVGAEMVKHETPLSVALVRAHIFVVTGLLQCVLLFSSTNDRVLRQRSEREGKDGEIS